MKKIGLLVLILVLIAGLFPNTACMAAGGPSLEVSLAADTPPKRIVAVGNNGTEEIVAKINLTAIGEAIDISSVTIKKIIEDQYPDFVDISLWDGSTQIGAPLFLPGTTFNFPADQRWRISANRTKTLDIRVKLAGIQTESTAGTVSGDTLKIGVDQITGYGVNSGQYISIEPNLYGNEMVLRKSKPYVTAASLPSTVLTAGEIVLYRWTVTADEKGNISWNKNLFDITGDMPSNLEIWNLNDMTEVSLAEEHIIPAGETKVYELRGLAMSVDKGYISTKIPKLSDTVVTCNLSSVDGSFIWSDLSGPNTWTNDYLVPGIPTATLSLTNGEPPTPTPSITVLVLSPNGGETFSAGGQMPISFSTTGNVYIGTHYYINLISQDSQEWPIVEGDIISGNIQNTGLTLPTGTYAFPSGNYRVRVSFTFANATIKDWSDNYFSVVAPTPVEPTTQVSIQAPVEVQSGSNFTARVSITQVENFDACNYDISFDPQVLQLDKVTAGRIGNVIIPVDIYHEREPGLWTIVQNVPGLTGVNGEGYLSELHFKAVDSSGESTIITLSSGILGNIYCEKILATWIKATVTITGIIESLQAQIQTLLLQLIALQNQLGAGDINGDGQTNVLDITKLERIIAGLD